MIGNGYAAGHADYALDVLRGSPGVRSLFEARHALRRQPITQPITGSSPGGEAL
jgi:hypothetical protein